MSAKRFVLACSAVGALMTAAPAQSPPEPLPAPRPVPILPALPAEAPVGGDARGDTRTVLNRFLNGSEAREIERTCRSATAGQRQVVVRAICFRMPPGGMFAEGLGRILNDQAGAADGKLNSRSWGLTPREARLVAALFASDQIDVMSRPTLTLTDDQTGFFQVGEQKPVITKVLVETKNGADVYTAQVTMLGDVGITFRATPKIAADGRSVRLRVEAEHREVNRPTLPVVRVGFVTDQGVVRNPALASEVGVGVSVQSVRTTVEVPDGGTAVVCCSEPDGRGAGEVFWLLCPHVIGGQPTAK